MKQLCFILDWYPTKTNNGCVFAKHLICAIADNGYECVVIAPMIKNTKNTSKDAVLYSRTDTTEQGNQIRVFTPTYLHLSSRRQTMKLSMNNHYKAVMKVIKKEKLDPDLVYGHFIYQCGLTAARIGKKLNIPSYCACGENSLRLIKGSEPYATGLRYSNWKSVLSSLSGVISVSEYNKELLFENGFIDKDINVGVFPNGFDKNKFYLADKNSARKKLNLPLDKFIVAFTGTFKESKGVKELCEALNGLEDVCSLFMGKGDISPDCKNILFCGSVPNDELVWYLNSADVFVLPTKGEGCCNAIVEALACGLPVVSSNLPFNDDILDESNSIRIDVDSVDEIKDAIVSLKTDEKLINELHTGAVKSAEKLDVVTRADNILKFMELSE